MLLINKRRLLIKNNRLPSVSSNKYILRINKAAQELLNYPKRVDIEIDTNSKTISIFKNDEQGQYTVTYFNQCQCCICIYQLFKSGIIPDKVKYIVRGESGKITFDY